MRPRSLRTLRVLIASFVGGVTIPLAAHLLNAQVMRCYVEVCIDKGTGQSCYEKPVPCPPHQVAPSP